MTVQEQHLSVKEVVSCQPQGYQPLLGKQINPFTLVRGHCRHTEKKGRWFEALTHQGLASLQLRCISLRTSTSSSLSIKDTISRSSANLEDDVKQQMSTLANPHRFKEEQANSGLDVIFVTPHNEGSQQAPSIGAQLDGVDVKQNQDTHLHFVEGKLHVKLLSMHS